MGKLLQEQQLCYSFDGEEHPAASVTGASTGVAYVYTTQEGANGVVLGLGGTPAEAETVMDLLLQDAIHPISMHLGCKQHYSLLTVHIRTVSSVLAPQGPWKRGNRK